MRRVLPVAAAVVVGLLAACDGSSGDRPDTAGVTAPGPATGTLPPRSTPVEQPDLATRAHLPPRRFTDAGADLDVDDQTGDGTSVRVDDATVTRRPGHVAIFTSDGRLLGSSYVTPRSAPVTVALPVPIGASGGYVAVLFSDDGDRRFEVARDVAITDGDGDPADALDLDADDFRYTLR